MKCQSICSTAGLVLLASIVFGAGAQTFPPTQVRLVVPFPPGGPTDVMGRHLGRALAFRLKTVVVVENRAGASAMIGSGYVARSAPDGATLLFQATHHVTNPVFFRKLPYDTQKDFSPVGLLASIASALVVHPSVPVKTTAQLIALAKRTPESLSIATFGGANQLSSELFRSMASIDLLNVGYSGEAPALSSVLGGHVPMMFDTISMVVGHIGSSKLRALGVTGAKRSSQLPNVPTIAESAPLSGYDAVAWFGLFMPAANGNTVESRLAHVMAEIQQSEEMRSTLLAMGAEPGTLTGPAFRKFVDAELVKWSAVGERAKIEKQ
jgi:tripartite-type tricarboxylate transporter receptor subunit TctC